jgi:hypothetical protein
MASYATVANFEAYVEGWVTDSEPALDRYLARASRDIDRIVGVWPYLSSGTYAGLKFNPAETDPEAAGYLAPHQKTAVVNATCAQAYYRIQLDQARNTSSGSSTTVSLPLGAKRVRGPDFEVEYATGTATVGSTLDATYPFSAQAVAELEGSGLVRRSFNGSVSTSFYDKDGNLL